MQISATQGRELLDLARSVIRSALAREQAVIHVPDDPALNQPAGAFVSLHSVGTHRLRGCVGRLDATQPMYQAVAHAAQSVLADPRFTSDLVTIPELSQLELEISLLSPLRPANGPMDFELLADGIVLAMGDRSGCFLPQVARETGWTKEQLLDRLCTEKMGMPARSWTLPQARLQKFATVLVGPEPFEPVRFPHG